MGRATTTRYVEDAVYVRFQGVVRHERRFFPGVFWLVNTLARDGVLSAEQERFRREGNDWLNLAYATPSQVDPTVYDRELNPDAVAWFKASAHHLVERVDGYLDILAAHGVVCERIESADPGRVVYEDEHQVVVVPRGQRRRVAQSSRRVREVRRSPSSSRAWVCAAARSGGVTGRWPRARHTIHAAPPR